ncbi:class I SAM-dependent methyltransferase [Pedobacter flavus]|uniref:SAM-dependent methyltransferase n=1 Tax=Pedobacter flavus TaxID=3113906 RepID=A0ABU7H0P8_9SPHI|nr:SAM-dependent methyltransferase [Pedobacter sp. VNH31]MEE1884906.1 SAM-dependent methyltransferase [Pedobacter sp. VNH31]
MKLDHLDVFKTEIQSSLENNSFVKLSLGNYKGEIDALKNIYVKPIFIKRQPHLSFTYRYKTRDIVKNFSIIDGERVIASALEDGFQIATLTTTAEEFQFEIFKSGKSVLRKRLLNEVRPVENSHNRKKQYKISNSAANYLQELGLTDANGTVYSNAQDKFKQINRYVELLAPLINELKIEHSFNVVDMGAGKGYLTFALYDYLVNSLKKQAFVKGIEFRQDLVDICNSIALHSGFQNLSFEQGTIQDYQGPTDILIALHACDTATDDAIAKGILGNAQLIIVAPCCHKQIRREIENNKVVNDISFLTKHGIFLERQAEMVTDGLRAMYLEYAGYKTKVFEFISDAHTPKNVMIVGVKKNEESERLKQERQTKILASIQDAKRYFGITEHHLGGLLGAK